MVKIKKKIILDTNIKTINSMAIIKKSTNSKCCRGCREGNSLHCWWECNHAATMENSMEGPFFKTKNRETILSSNPTHRHISRKR